MVDEAKSARGGAGAQALEGAFGEPV
jgi:hypothetical protein